MIMKYASGLDFFSTNYNSLDVFFFVVVIFARIPLWIVTTEAVHSPAALTTLLSWPVLSDIFVKPTLVYFITLPDSSH